MKTDRLLLAALAALLVAYSPQALCVTDTLREARELGARADEVAAEQREIMARIQSEERVVAAEAVEAPVAESDPPPEFFPLPVDLEEELQRHAWELCQRYGVPFEVVMAIAWHESRFDVTAVGYNANGTQDSGVMQINDINREWLHEQHGLDIEDPYDNIEAGILILSLFWEKYTPEMALTAYGWGEAGMLNAGEPAASAYRVLEKSEEFAERG